MRTRAILGSAFAAGVGWACLTPGLPSPTMVPGVDKLQHAAVMACLAAWFATLFERHMVAVVLGVVAYGGAIELIQAFLNYRNGDILDFGADCAGVALGIGVVVAATRWHRKIEEVSYDGTGFDAGD